MEPARRTKSAGSCLTIQMLEFTPVTIDAAEQLKAFARQGLTHSCDYTPGNLIMWADYMQYDYAIENGTLFISCLSQYNLKEQAFLPPIGKMPLRESIEMLQEFCNANNRALRFTAVPQEFHEQFTTLLPNHKCIELDGWADYIHRATDIATLQGKALNKRRNRRNKFLAEHPDYEYRRYTVEEASAVTDFILGKGCNEAIMRCYEIHQSIATVRNLPIYHQPAAIIKIDSKTVAFTLGEVWNDTLYIHIEKADREFPGLGETLASSFAADIQQEYPQVTLINREEDLGDEGLRQAKKAYNPIMLLNRYEFLPQ